MTKSIALPLVVKHLFNCFVGCAYLPFLPGLILVKAANPPIYPIFDLAAGLQASMACDNHSSWAVPASAQKLSDQLGLNADFFKT